MMKLLPLLAFSVLAACEARPMDPLEAARLCEDRARAARGPTGEVAVGASSSDGPFAGVGITLSSDYLSGRDPLEVYRTCVVERTGAEPVRPAAL
jgi:hypothetical protein